MASGVVTVPKVIATGETVTIPTGRIAVLPNLQIDGTLDIQGDVFIPSGATFDGVVEKVASTDNAVVRFNGITGEVQNSAVSIDDNGNVVTYGNDKGIILSQDKGGGASILYSTNGNLSITPRSGFDTVFTSGKLTLNSPTGGLGYGIGSGGIVTQLTSKTTAVTLNKPSGQIIMNNASLAPGISVTFILNNTLVTRSDTCILIINGGVSEYGSYRVQAYSIDGSVAITVTNQTSATTLAEAISIQFNIIKGVNS